jgi:prepilin-type N-terminal cleavage/methylation domain-containing protein
MQVSYHKGRQQGSPTSRQGRCRAGFTLIEVMVASALVGIIFTALLAGFTMSFQSIQVDRENSRATQIMIEKTEVIRLYNWDQITGADTNTFVPTTFTAPYYPDNNNGGFSYDGRVAITNVPISSTYSNDLRSVTITLNWVSGKAPRTRSMTTWVSKYGLQNYIY